MISVERLRSGEVVVKIWIALVQLCGTRRAVGCGWVGTHGERARLIEDGIDVSRRR